MLDRNTAEDGGTVPRIRRRVFVIPTVVLIAITTVMVSPSATSGHTTSATSALPSRSAVGHHFADSVSDDLSAKPHQADASRSTHSPRLHHYTYHLTIPNGEGVCPVVPDTSFPSLCRASSSPAGSPSPQPHDSSQGSCLQSWESPPLCVDCP
ncbi:MAG TPA: hypothetical protein VMU77_00560, partial [Acidimicrobiales bacterium]|nr:hypothetical protein [Acidimicrobiales bacterium]